MGQVHSIPATIAATLPAPSEKAAAQSNGDPDPTRAGAVNLCHITGRSRAKGGVNDTVDHFSFSLTASREVMVKLKQVERSANLYVYDRPGMGTADRPPDRDQPGRARNLDYSDAPASVVFNSGGTERNILLPRGQRRRRAGEIRQTRRLRDRPAPGHRGKGSGHVP